MLRSLYPNNSNNVTATVFAKMSGIGRSICTAYSSATRRPLRVSRASLGCARCQPTRERNLSSFNTTTAFVQSKKERSSDPMESGILFQRFFREATSPSAAPEGTRRLQPRLRSVKKDHY